MTHRYRMSAKKEIEVNSNLAKLYISAFLVMACIGLTLAPLSGFAAEFNYYEDFRNVDEIDEMSIEITRVRDNGEFELTKNGLTFFGTRNTSSFTFGKLDGDRIDARSGWSFRTLVTLDDIVEDDSVFFAIGTSDYHHAGLVETEEGESSLRVGICNGRVCAVDVQSVSYPFLGEEMFLQFDGYDDELLASVWKPGELDSLVQYTLTHPMSRTLPEIALDGEATVHEMWITSFPIPIPSSTLGDFNFDGVLDAQDIDLLTENLGGHGTQFDVNNDNLVDLADHETWVKELKSTWLGDANLDDEFNSGDLVALFAAGEYEDGMRENSNWATGDFNADAEFDSGDLVAAFTDGGYEQGPRVPAMAVPEPTSFVALITGLIGLAVASNCRRKAV